MAEQLGLESPESASEKRQVPLDELALFFLRLGTTAFGGPAAHIAIMEDELVRRRQLLSREEFLDLLGASNLIPGPSSSELAIHIGYLRAGWRGMLIAGTCFILPAALMVAGVGWLYLRFGQASLDRRHPLWNQAGRHRGRSSSSLESYPNSGKDNVSWTRSGVCARALCSRFASTAIASTGRWSSVRACAKNLACVVLGASCSDDWRRNLSDHGIVQPCFAFSGLLEAWGNRFRQRLCALGLPSSRSGHPSRLVDGRAAGRCCCCGAGDARTGFHDRHVYRLHSGRNSRGHYCHGRHLPSRISTGSSKRSTRAAYSKVQACGSFP